MNILQIGILIFAIIEVGNVMMLYFMPGSRMGNGVGVFNAWEASKKDENIHELMKYLVYWVAGAKLIFIMMGIVVIVWGDIWVQLFTVVALIISIASFFWRLFPMIRRLDKKGEITPKGYNKTLALMIAAFIIGFLAVLIVALIQYF
ncbi:MAG: hypothetical protein HN948_10830 [Clostridia bacterium]|nr:hypothetical protein [Clostridia bacterium]MBT7123491.1 hypothetical protein [Clostridia bacterium]